jgi:hypothetical protein
VNAHAMRRLDRLLSGSQLSVQEADAILAAVLARVRRAALAGPDELHGRSPWHAAPRTPGRLKSLLQRGFSAHAGRPRRCAAGDSVTAPALLLPRAPRAPASARSSTFRDGFRADRRSGGRWLTVAGVTLAGAVAAVLAGVVVPRPGLGPWPKRHEEVELVSRGGEVPASSVSGASGAFRLICVTGRTGSGARAGSPLPSGSRSTAGSEPRGGSEPRSRSVCRQGGRLLFDLRPVTAGKYFSSVALADDGLLIWYFPSDTQASILTREGGIADTGVLVAGEQEPGHYRVFGAFSDRPLARDELRPIIDGQPPGPDLHIDLSEVDLEVLPP